MRRTDNISENDLDLLRNHGNMIECSVEETREIIRRIQNSDLADELETLADTVQDEKAGCAYVLIKVVP